MKYLMTPMWLANFLENHSVSGTAPINRGEPFDGLKKAGPSGILPDVLGLRMQDHVWRKPAMNPQTPFCHNPACPARGRVGQGNIRAHSLVEQRSRCSICGQTFAATKGTPFYRLRTAADLVTIVLTLRWHGCPLQAIMAAFGLDERTVTAWVAPKRRGRPPKRALQPAVAVAA
jgi:transposase-like protein